jgi:hypothetical protein
MEKKDVELVSKIEEGRKISKDLINAHNEWIAKNLQPVEVKDEDGLEKVVDILHYSKKATKTLDETRLSITKVYRDRVDGVNNWFKENFTDSLNQIASWSDKAVIKYKSEQLAIQRAAIEKENQRIKELADASIAKQVAAGVDEDEAKARVAVTVAATQEMVQQDLDSYSTRSSQKTTMGKLTTSESWEFDPINSNMIELIKFIAANPDREDLIVYLDWNTTNIRKMRPTKTFTPPKIAGIEWEMKLINSARK